MVVDCQIVGLRSPPPKPAKQAPDVCEAQQPPAVGVGVIDQLLKVPAEPVVRDVLHLR